MGDVGVVLGCLNVMGSYDGEEQHLFLNAVSRLSDVVGESVWSFDRCCMSG